MAVFGARDLGRSMMLGAAILAIHAGGLLIIDQSLRSLPLAIGSRYYGDGRHPPRPPSFPLRDPFLPGGRPMGPNLCFATGTAADEASYTGRKTIPAIAVGRSQDWISHQDYARFGLNRTHEGIVKAQLTITQSGRVRACSIVQPSGYSDLDRATCTALISRARFVPPCDKFHAVIDQKSTISVIWRAPARI